MCAEGVKTLYVLGTNRQALQVVLEELQKEKPVTQKLLKLDLNPDVENQGLTGLTGRRTYKDEPGIPGQSLLLARALFERRSAGLHSAYINIESEVRFPKRLMEYTTSRTQPAF